MQCHVTRCRGPTRCHHWALPRRHLLGARGIACDGIMRCSRLHSSQRSVSTAMQPPSLPSRVSDKQSCALTEPVSLVRDLLPAEPSLCSPASTSTMGATKEGSSAAVPQQALQVLQRTVAEEVGLLALSKEVALLTNMSGYLRRHYNKQRRMHMHQQRRPLPRTPSSSGHDEGEAGDSKTDASDATYLSIEKLCVLSSVFPAKTKQAQSHALQLQTLLLLIKHNPVELPVCAVQRLAEGLEPETVWELLRHREARPSLREREAVRLVGQISSQKGELPPALLRALWNTCAAPFLRSCWGITFGSGSTADTPSLLSPLCTSESLPVLHWERYLQLDRLPLQLREHVRGYLLRIVREEAQAWVLLNEDASHFSLPLALQAAMDAPACSNASPCCDPRHEEVLSSMAATHVPASGTQSTAFSAPSPSTSRGSHAGGRVFQPSPTDGPLIGTAPSPSPTDTFESRLQAVLQVKNSNALFHFTQTVMRAIFNGVLPHLDRNHGRRMDLLEQRVRWAKWGAVVGSLDSVLLAFEELFFVLYRPTGERGGDTTCLASDGVQEKGGGAITARTLVWLHQGPVGPWLLYGRLIARFFPTSVRFPLGFVAESLSWGLYLAPRFGDLPSVLRTVGRVVDQGVLLPVSVPRAVADGAEWESDAEAVAEDLRFMRALQTVLGVNLCRAMADETCSTAKDAARHCVTVEELSSIVDAACQSPVPQSPLGRADGLPTVGREDGYINRMVGRFPLHVQWRRPVGHPGDLCTLELRQPLPRAQYCAVGAFLECYVFPLLRDAVPLSVATIEALLGWRNDAFASHPAWRDTGLPSPSKVSLLGVLWYYTHARAPASASEGGRVYGKRCCLILFPAGDTVFVSPRRGVQLGIQDALCIVNGLTWRSSTPFSDNGADVPRSCGESQTLERADGVCLSAAEDVESRKSCASALSLRHPFFLSASTQPVSLMELLAEEEELQSLARQAHPLLDASDDVDDQTEGAHMEYSAQWLTVGASQTPSFDVIVWRA